MEFIEGEGNTAEEGLVTARCCCCCCCCPLFTPASKLPLAEGIALGPVIGLRDEAEGDRTPIGPRGEDTTYPADADRVPPNVGGALRFEPFLPKVEKKPAFELKALGALIDRLLYRVLRGGRTPG